MFLKASGIPEKRRFETVGENNVEKGNVGVELCELAKLICRKNFRMEGHQQVIERAPEDTTQPIDCCFTE